MPVEFTCPHCGARTNVDDQYVGQSGPCSSCGKPVTVPAPAATGQSAPPKPGGGGTSVTVILIAVLVGGGVLLMCVVGILVALLLPAVQSGREAARRMQCANNLKMIGLAMHNYHDVWNTFPPAYLADEQGRAMHSWRTLLLPYMDAAHVYQQYDLGLAWDDPGNRGAIATEISAYGCPSEDEQRVNYVVVRSPSGIFPNDQSRSFGQVPDGAFRTLLVVEVPGQIRSWAEPRDVTLDELRSMLENAAMGQTHWPHRNTIQVLMADGRVTQYDYEGLLAELDALVSAAGGD